MSNDIRETRSNPVLVPPTAYPERILRNQDLSFRSVYSHENPRRADSIKREPIHTLYQAFSSLVCKGPSASATSRAQSAHVAVIPDVESSSHVRGNIWQIVVEEVACGYTKLSLQATQQAMENTLLEILLSGYNKAGGRMRKASYWYFEMGFTKMAEKKTLDELFIRIFERWAQPTMLMNSFTPYALSWSCVMDPVTNFVTTRMDETADEWLSTARFEGFSHPSNVFLCPIPLPSSTSNDKLHHKKHCVNKKNSSAPKAQDLQDKPKGPL